MTKIKGAKNKEERKEGWKDNKGRIMRKKQKKNKVKKSGKQRG